MESTQFFPQWIKKQIPEKVESRFFKSSLGKIHYLTGGKGTPVILLHGNPTWSFLWRKVIAQLDETKFQFFAPDLMNLGFSDKLSYSQFSMNNHVKYVREFIEAQNLQNAILVVQDWGGPIGLLAASQLKNIIKGLVVLNTGVGVPKMPLRSKFHKLSNTLIISNVLFSLFHFPLYSLHKVQYDKNSIKGDVARAYRYPLKEKRNWSSAMWYARMVPTSRDHDSYQNFSAIEHYCTQFDGPVEVVWGIKDPILGRQIHKTKKIFPGANYSEVIAGHFLQEECPEDIAAAITRLPPYLT